MNLSRLILAAVLPGLLVAVWGCDDKATEPPPHEPDYRLLVNCVANPDPFIHFYYLVYSTKTDSVIDSIHVGEEYSECALFSPDGNIIYQTNISDFITYSLDWRSGETLAVNNDYGGLRADLSAGEDYLLISESDYTALLHLPDMDEVYAITKRRKGQLIPHRRLFCSHQHNSDTMHYCDYSGPENNLYAFQLRDSIILRYGIQAFTPTRSGDSLIIIGYENYMDSYLFIATTDSLKILRKMSIPNHDYYHSHIIVGPDGEKVYFYFSGSHVSTKWGEVYELNIVTREMRILMDSGDHNYFVPRDISLTPGGEYLYVVEGELFKIRLADRQIMDLTYGGGIFGLSLSLNPVDMSQ